MLLVNEFFSYSFLCRTSNILQVRSKFSNWMINQHSSSVFFDIGGMLLVLSQCILLCNGFI